MLQAAKDLFRSHLPMLEEDRRLKPQLDLATRLVREGAFIDTVGRENMPAL